MSCKKIQQLISPYLDGELSPGEMETVKTHVDSCAYCRQEFEKMMGVSAALRQVGRDILPAPNGFSDSVIDCIRKTAAAGESVKPLSWVKDIRKWIGGIAAAAVIAFCTSSWIPVLQVAENPPGESPKIISNLLEPEKNDDGVIKNNPIIPDPGNDTAYPGGDTGDPAVPNHHEINEGEINTLEEPAEKYYEADITLLNTVPVIKSTMLQLEVDDSAAALARVLDTASGHVKTVQKVNEDGYTIVKITVPVSEANKFIQTFSNMGRIVSNQENEKDAAKGYSNSLEQYQVLISQYNDSDAEEQAQLLKQINSLETQLANWQKEAEKQTIVLVVQQK